MIMPVLGCFKLNRRKQSRSHLQATAIDYSFQRPDISAHTNAMAADSPEHETTSSIATTSSTETCSINRSTDICTRRRTEDEHQTLAHSLIHGLLQETPHWDVPGMSNSQIIVLEKVNDEIDGAGRWHLPAIVLPPARTATLLELANHYEKFPQARSAIFQTLQMRVFIILQHFISDVPGLLRVMQSTRSVASGSAVLAALMPIASLQWSKPPNDLDLYAPRDSHKPLVRCLLACGFRMRDGHSQPIPFYMKALRDVIHAVYCLQHPETNVRIDVIVSANTSSIFPILRHHSTMVMNVLTGSHVISLYPQTTHANRGFYNPTTHRQLLDQTLPTRTIIALDKYTVDRHFDLIAFNNPSGWNFPHTCGEDERCPHTGRYVGDEHCVKLKFFDNPLSSSLENVRWVFGGAPCHEGGVMNVWDCEIISQEV